MSELDTLIMEWQQAKLQAAKLVEHERELRKTIFNIMFPKPKEGTNTAALGNGWKLKATYPIDRKLDMPVFEAIQNQFYDKKIPTDIVKMEPKLSVKVYRTLSDEQRLFFDAALISRPGSVQLEIVPPKED